jgi:hypothetical protein
MLDHVTNAHFNSFTLNYCNFISENYSLLYYVLIKIECHQGHSQKFFVGKTTKSRREVFATQFTPGYAPECHSIEVF